MISFRKSYKFYYTDTYLIKIPLFPNSIRNHMGFQKILIKELYYL